MKQLAIGVAVTMTLLGLRYFALGMWIRTWRDSLMHHQWRRLCGPTESPRREGE
jgi:hypothetical protein